MAKDNSDFFEKKNEWSIIKDNLLGCYLKPYFQKLLTSRKPICYVDCFSGKGKFKDGNDGSPLIALKIREKCLNKTSRVDKYGAISFFFIEKYYAVDLKQNIGDDYSQYGVPEVLNGKFEDEIQLLLKGKCKQNVFLYIDPYGITALDFKLFEILGNSRFNSFEMLINFNSFGFFRVACSVMKVKTRNDEAFQGVEELMECDPTETDIKKGCTPELLTKIAGGEYWKDIVNDYKKNRINGYEAERRFSTEYKRLMRRSFKYVLDMPIRLQSSHHAKYRMIHVCNHEDGCFLMVQNMLKRKEELVMNVWQDKQLSLFDSDLEDNPDIITEELIEQKVRKLLEKTKNDINITKFLAEFMTENGIICDFNTIYNVLSEMESDGEIYIKREPAYTSLGKKRTFWVEEKKMHVILSKRWS